MRGFESECGCGCEGQSYVIESFLLLGSSNMVDG